MILRRFLKRKEHRRNLPPEYLVYNLLRYPTEQHSHRGERLIKNILKH